MKLIKSQRTTGNDMNKQLGYSDPTRYPHTSPVASRLLKKW